MLQYSTKALRHCAIVTLGQNEHLLRKCFLGNQLIHFDKLSIICSYFDTCTGWAERHEGVSIFNNSLIFCYNFTIPISCCIPTCLVMDLQIVFSCTPKSLAIVFLQLHLQFGKEFLGSAHVGAPDLPLSSCQSICRSIGSHSCIKTLFTHYTLQVAGEFQKVSNLRSSSQRVEHDKNSCRFVMFCHHCSQLDV
jgi:hypothetical protein